MNSAQNAPTLPKLMSNMGLKHRNTFGFDVLAELAYEISAAEQIPRVMQQIAEQKLPWRVLGAGSNVILPKVLPGVTLLMSIPGKELGNSNGSDTIVSVGAGVNWHDFVSWTLEQQLPGLENLALIPGTVGAAPIQNIGAYGAEISGFIDNIEAFDTAAHAFVTLSNEACSFAYRDSYFKQNPHRFIITKVDFKIPKAWEPRLQYGDLAKLFIEANTKPTAQEIFTAVCNIRSQKLPDPKVIGNAGSFFQNPIIPDKQYIDLLQIHPQLVSFPDQVGRRKLAAGWLIDQCGFKGQQVGAVGVYQNQALVLVNHGDGTAEDILGLAKLIQDKVQETFGIQLEIEPNIL